MRSFGRVAIVVLACMALVSVASAGEYHRGATLLCADCHVMHGQQGHGYNADGGGFTVPIGGTSPYTYLLRNEINALCLTCHDGQTFAPDVFSQGTGPTIRQAGGLNRLGGSPYFPTTGHTLDATDMAPGGSWEPDPTHGLVCTDCHQQHGYAGPGEGNPEFPTGTYRNLQYAPGDQYSFVDPALVSYALGTNVLTRDVFIDTSLSIDIYDQGNVFFNEPDSDGTGGVEGSALARNCAGCHTDFFGIPGSTEVSGSGGTMFHRHPSSVVNIGGVGGGHSSLTVYNGHTNKVKVMATNEDWDPAIANDATPTCISCHKAHGNQNSFGLIYMSGTGTVSEEGDDGGAGALEDLCGQCHVQVG